MAELRGEFVKTIRSLSCLKTIVLKGGVALLNFKSKIDAQPEL